MKKKQTSKYGTGIVLRGKKKAWEKKGVSAKEAKVPEVLGPEENYSDLARQTSLGSLMTTDAFDLNLIEKDLAELKKDLFQVKEKEGFLEKFFSGDPLKREVDRLKLLSEKTALIKTIGENLITIATQSYTMAEKVLNRKAALLQQGLAISPRMQKAIADLEVENQEIMLEHKKLEKLRLRAQVENFGKLPLDYEQLDSGRIFEDLQTLVKVEEKKEGEEDTE